MNPTEKEEYRRVETDCRNLMRMISEILDRKMAQYNREGIHRRHVGDLQRTKSLLRETVTGFLYTPEGTETEVQKAIDAELEKMRKGA